MALYGGWDSDRSFIANTRPIRDTVIPVMNLSDELRTLYRGTRISQAYAITKCDRVKGLLPATPLL